MWPWENVVLIGKSRKLGDSGKASEVKTPTELQGFDIKSHLTMRINWVWNQADFFSCTELLIFAQFFLIKALCNYGNEFCRASSTISNSLIFEIQKSWFASEFGFFCSLVPRSKKLSETSSAWNTQLVSDWKRWVELLSILATHRCWCTTVVEAIWRLEQDLGSLFF